MAGLGTIFVNRFIRHNPVRVFWIYRSFIWNSAVNEFRYRYAGSALGVFWNLLIPLAQILIYTVVFARIMPVRLPGAILENAFPIYLCAGLLPWLAFAECVSRGTHCFLENANYLKKLAIPEQVFVARNAVGATINLVASMILLACVSFAVGGMFSWAWLCAIPVIVLLQSVGFGLGLTLGSLNVFFRDVGQVLWISLQMWMWMTPIVYVKEILPPSIQELLVYNPAFPFMEALQGIVVRGAWPSGMDWGLMILWATAFPLLGYLVLRKLRPEIRDVL